MEKAVGLNLVIYFSQPKSPSTWSRVTLGRRTKAQAFREEFTKFRSFVTPTPFSPTSRP